MKYEPDARRSDIILILTFFTLGIITRVPFASKLLYHMDSGHFALALENYDITVHQPHPPGYFLYVMLGRAVHLFIDDANTVFVSISIFFSGLAVAAVYMLGREIFGRKAGIIAAAIALSSPNLWFHGEVALSYIVEAFFSTAVALLCWKIYRGEHKYLWLSALMLGVAGGIRQNSVVFLLPVWLFSVRNVPHRQKALSVLLLGAESLLWFIPMIHMTGGWQAYHDALQELMIFNTGNVSVFERGWKSFQIFFPALIRFIIYGLGFGIFVLVPAGYALLRSGKTKNIERSTTLFIICWILPAVLFYVTIFIHPANPGYALLFLPALFILTGESICYLGNKIRNSTGRNMLTILAAAVVCLNSLFFMYSDYAVSSSEIRMHDRHLEHMLSEIRRFDSEKTAVFVGPFILYGYRQIMYYLPDFRVYQVDVRIAKSGVRRKTFWGSKGETFVSDTIILPREIDRSIAFVFEEDMGKVKNDKRFAVKTVFPGFNLVAGPCGTIPAALYPELEGYIMPATVRL